VTFLRGTQNGAEKKIVAVLRGRGGKTKAVSSRSGERGSPEKINDSIRKEPTRRLRCGWGQGGGVDHFKTPLRTNKKGWKREVAGGNIAKEHLEDQINVTAKKTGPRFGTQASFVSRRGSEPGSRAIIEGIFSRKSPSDQRRILPAAENWDSERTNQLLAFDFKNYRLRADTGHRRGMNTFFELPLLIRRDERGGGKKTLP